MNGQKQRHTYCLAVCTSGFVIRPFRQQLVRVRDYLLSGPLAQHRREGRQGEDEGEGEPQRRREPHGQETGVTGAVESGYDLFRS